jgi:hypothetical protein
MQQSYKLALGDYAASLMADVLSHLPKRKHFTQKHVAENAENQPPARRESLIEQELALSLSFSEQIHFTHNIYSSRAVRLPGVLFEFNLSARHQINTIKTFEQKKRNLFFFEREP